MTGFLIGLITAIAVMAFATIVRTLDHKLYATLSLAVIPFIYIGFSLELRTLMLTIPSAAFFVLLAYLGYKKNYLVTVAGLAIHGLWDLLFPFLSKSAPQGYDLFCITIDLVLAMYFYIKLRPTTG